jgi:nucleotide-binding universal stress UspA family protein
MQAIEFRRILCPINFAEGSRRTVEGASLLAAMYGAELRLFHVVCDGSRSLDADSLMASLFALTRTLPERSRVSAALAFGDPSSEITQHARLMGADLIVLGTERRSAPAKVRRTIVADVATHAACPVLHVRPHLLPSLSDTSRGFTEIVCCVDSFAGAMPRDDYAHALARLGDARVTMLNVVAADEDTSETMREAAKDVDGKRHVVHVSLTGSPGPEIVALAQQIRADLIVIGARDEASPEQRLGSTTAYVMVNAPCPVLIVTHASSVFQIASNRPRIVEPKGLSQ